MFRKILIAGVFGLGLTAAMFMTPAAEARVGGARAAYGNAGYRAYSGYYGGYRASPGYYGGYRAYPYAYSGYGVYPTYPAYGYGYTNPYSAYPGVYGYGTGVGVSPYVGVFPGYRR